MRKVLIPPLDCIWNITLGLITFETETLDLFIWDVTMTHILTSSPGHRLDLHPPMMHPLLQALLQHHQLMMIFLFLNHHQHMMISSSSRTWLDDYQLMISSKVFNHMEHNLFIQLIENVSSTMWLSLITTTNHYLIMVGQDTTIFPFW